MKATLTLNLEIGFYEGQSMTMQVLSNSEEVVPTRTFSDAKTPITFDLNLPTKLDIILDNRLDSDVRTDAQGNIIFNGEIKNIGGRRSDFVKVDFVFRKNWSGETKTLTTFIKGGYHTFDSGITTDSTLLPGATGAFELYVPHDFGSFIGYSYVIDWEEYE